MRTHIDLTGIWRFTLDDPAGAEKRGHDDTGWTEVTVPHDWAVLQPITEDLVGGESQGFYNRWGVGWYRNEIDLNPESDENVFLVFDGVFHESDVYVNGHHVGRKHYGYTAFHYDITKHITSGKNTVAVRVDNSVEHKADRWYSGCGIYRPVSVVICHKSHFNLWGVHITCDSVTKKQAEVHTHISTSPETPDGADVTVRVLGPDGLEATVANGIVSSGEATISVPVAQPQRWSPDSPGLYRAQVELNIDERVTDSVSQTFGIRTVELAPNIGILLNGENVKLKGVNLHHDLGITGSAWNRSLAERRLRKLKEIGCNAVRTSHNPPASEFLDLCDVIGLWVIDEAFDKWESMRYGLIFDESWQEDIDAMVLRDFNHPCIFAWSVGNEIDNQGEPEMLDTARMLVHRVRELDPSRPVTFAQHPHAWPEEVHTMTITQKAERTAAMAELVDFVSLNYQEQWYDACKEKKEDILIVGSETYMYFRGHGNSFASYRPENPYLDVTRNPYVFGHFVWAGIDYLGEAVWPARGWPGCLMDTNCVLREAGHLTRMLWQGTPAVHMAVHDPTERNQHGNIEWCAPGMAGHWNVTHLSSRVLEVSVFTTCDEVELILNGDVIDRKSTEDYPLDFRNAIVPFYVPNIPGTIRVVGYIDGNAAAEQVYETTGEPHRVRMFPERETAAANGRDVIPIRVTVEDSAGRRCPRVELPLVFEVDAPGLILGTDAGDLTDHEPYATARRTSFRGICYCYVVATEPGTFDIRVSSEGVEQNSVTLAASAVEG